jgi:cephalosporin hydroxylase
MPDRPSVRRRAWRLKRSVASLLYRASRALGAPETRANAVPVARPAPAAVPVPTPQTVEVGQYVPPRVGRMVADAAEQAIVDRFMTLYYGKWVDGLPTVDLSWMGYKAWKLPLDLWIYQEILFQRRPDIIIETGTHLGGSGLFLASICQLLGHGRVVSIDVEDRPGLPVHPLLRYIVGSSAAPSVVETVRRLCEGTERRMVILDSDHTYAHVSAELEAYASLVSVGDYLVVEDTSVNGYPLLPAYGAGPMEAARDFLARDARFVIDDDCERFMATLNPRGYLRRV